MSWKRGNLRLERHSAPSTVEAKGRVGYSTKVSYEYPEYCIIPSRGLIGKAHLSDL